MNKSKGMITSLCALALVTGACNRVPSYVIQPEEMAQLMADIHIGEAVVDYNRASYTTDSAKLVLKQSIYAKHGVTPEQVDTSFDWYGHNIGRYMDVYDRTIEILDARLSETGNRIAAEASMSIAGDSVDVWANSRFITISKRLPSNFVVFNINKDQNWESGDSYTWRVKFANNSQSAHWGIVTEYTDGSSEFINTTITGDGWREISLFTDSLLNAKRIYGYLEVNPEGDRNVWLDSIALVRNRLNPAKYGQHYRQHKLHQQKSNKD
jgi:hypothetical protein